jgi:hypothetical protein
MIGLGFIVPDLDLRKGSGICPLNASLADVTAIPTPTGCDKIFLTIHPDGFIL